MIEEIKHSQQTLQTLTGPFISATCYQITGSGNLKKGGENNERDR